MSFNLISYCNNCHHIHKITPKQDLKITVTSVIEERTEYRNAIITSIKTCLKQIFSNFESELIKMGISKTPNCIYFSYNGIKVIDDYNFKLNSTSSQNVSQLTQAVIKGFYAKPCGLDFTQKELAINESARIFQAKFSVENERIKQEKIINDLNAYGNSEDVFRSLGLPPRVAYASLRASRIPEVNYASFCKKRKMEEKQA